MKLFTRSFWENKINFRDGSRTPATSKIKVFRSSCYKGSGVIMEIIPQVWLQLIDTEGEQHAPAISVSIIWKKVAVI